MGKTTNLNWLAGFQPSTVVRIFVGKHISKHVNFDFSTTFPFKHSEMKIYQIPNSLKNPRGLAARRPLLLSLPAFTLLSGNPCMAEARKRGWSKSTNLPLIRTIDLGSKRNWDLFFNQNMLNQSTCNKFLLLFFLVWFTTSTAWWDLGLVSMKQFEPFVFQHRKANDSGRLRYPNLREKCKWPRCWFQINLHPAPFRLLAHKLLRNRSRFSSWPCARPRREIMKLGRKWMKLRGGTIGYGLVNINWVWPPSQ